MDSIDRFYQPVEGEVMSDAVAVNVEYKPLTREERIEHFTRLSPERQMIALYAELLEFREYVQEFEAKAAEMSSPDKMMEMAQKFLGNGFM
jgi:hypothetical protein